MRSIFSASRKALTALVASLALLLTGAAAYAQTTSGKVIDTNGVPVIGAAVMVPGTTTGAVTDVDGNFELRVAPGTRTKEHFFKAGATYFRNNCYICQNDRIGLQHLLLT